MLPNERLEALAPLEQTGPLPKERLEALFPLERADPPPGTFELGLVLGGTVSAGAYTAGAIDFLLEALSAWYEDGPLHKVSIPIVAGASGGGVCATLLGLISHRKINHIHETYGSLLANTADRGNILFDIWVNRFDVVKLLGDSDLDAPAPQSLLDSGLLGAMASELAHYAKNVPPSEVMDRPYFPKPYRWFVTLSNLRGIPYQLDVATLNGFHGAVYRQHDDYARFAIGNGADPAIAKREDEFWVVPAGGSLDDAIIPYEDMADFALGTAAFPLGFVGRELKRPIQHHRLRPLLHPRKDGVTYDDVKWPRSLDEQVQTPGTSHYEFTTVDGGVFNNDPVRLVHRDLAGLIGHNPREADKATRALFMIDPLAAKPAPLPSVTGDLKSVLPALISAVVGGGRYLTADMQLIGDKGVFSRFQLVPSRLAPDGTQLIGEDALTGSAAGAFGGFCSRAFRVHDFLLGRANMRHYLDSILTLRGDNTLFAGWNDDKRRDYARDFDGNRINPDLANKASYYLPVVPLRPELQQQPALPWPKDALNPKDLRGKFDHRIEGVLNRIRKNAWPGLPGWLIGTVVVDLVLSNRLADAVVDWLSDDLRKKGLLSV